jgi:RNA recognition motif-containing protein
MRHEKGLIMTNIYVGNLPYATQEEDLIEHFSQWGEVDRATLVFDRETGRPRGFGFVEMEIREEAEAAIEQAHGAEFKGRPLTVNEARPRGSGRIDTPTLTRSASRHEHPSTQTAGQGYRGGSAGRTAAPRPQTPRDHAGPSRTPAPISQRSVGGGYANLLYG